LSFFAAEAGAKKVYAVEIDPFLASCLRRSVAANGLCQVIEVVQGDIHSAPLPQSPDVLICEMMDTGLLDEKQVTALNALRGRNVITEATRLIPRRYDTFLEFGFTNFDYYTYKILAPKHDWPHYSGTENGWLPTEFLSLSDLYWVSSIDFHKPIASLVDTILTMNPRRKGLINAVRLSARAHLTEGVILGATNALNGDKTLPIDETRVMESRSASVRVRYQMGEGLDSLQINFLQE
jgi:predicted RNA methylase